MSAPSLRKLENEFMAALKARRMGTAPEFITPGGPLKPRERFEIYHYAYHGRLSDSLAEDFEGVAQALGAEAFEKLSGDYFEKHPSDSPCLIDTGRFFPAFIKRHAVSRQKPWLEELARLEWALIETFYRDDEPAPAGALAPLAALPPEAQARARLRFHPSLRLFAARWQVQRFLESETARAPRSGPVTLALWQQDRSAEHASLAEEEGRLLQSLMKGAPLGKALAKISPKGRRHVADWLKAWAARGWITGFTAARSISSRSRSR